MGNSKVENINFLIYLNQHRLHTVQQIIRHRNNTIKSTTTKNKDQAAFNLNRGSLVQTHHPKARNGIRSEFTGCKLNRYTHNANAHFFVAEKHTHTHTNYSNIAERIQMQLKHVLFSHTILDRLQLPHQNWKTIIIQYKLLKFDQRRLN